MEPLQIEKIVVRPVEEHDFSALQLFYSQAYGHRAHYKYPERWNWSFYHNPWHGSMLRVYVAIAKDLIVGHTAAVTVPFMIRSEENILSWSVDTIVLPEFRGKGIGKKLQHINQEANIMFASLSMSDVNRKIKLDLGGIEQGTLTSFVKYLPQVQENVFSKLFAYGISALSSIAYFLGKGQKKYQPRKVIFRSSNAKFTEEDTRLWLGVKADFELAVNRSLPYLTWRYCDVPWQEYKCIRAFDESNELIGLLIYRVTLETDNKGVVVTELISKQNDYFTIQQLLKQLEKTARNSSQICIGTSTKSNYAALLQLGYLPYSQKRMVLNSNSSNKTDLKNMKIYLTLGDHDCDQYPLSKLIPKKSIIKFMVRSILTGIN